MSYEAIAARCGRALEALRDQLPAACYREAYDWIHRHGEYGLAVEFLIDWIGEFELEITPDQMHSLAAAMAAMGRQESDRMVWLRRRQARTTSHREVEG